MPLLALLDALGSDARLSAPLTVGERYLPLPEFAERLVKATKAPMRIARVMSERKLTLFVDGKPASETMRMVANALGGEWSFASGTWTLRPDPKIVRDEQVAADSDEAARRTAVLAWAEAFARDSTPYGDNPGIAKAAELVAKIGPQALADTLLSGRALIATSSGRDGSVQVSLADAFDAETTDGVLSLRIPEGGTLVTIRLTPLMERGVGGGIVTGVGVAVPEPKTPTRYARRAEAWGADADPQATGGKLATPPLGKEPYPSGLESLADVLERLHARGGVPVAAESFRAPFRLFGEIPGTTVREALEALAKETGWTRARTYWRSEGGWVLARYARPLSYRPGEIPEARLRPLEGKYPSLDAYADLAAGLTPPQTEATNHYRPLVRFSTVPLRSVRALAFYGSLSATERAAARDKGLPYAQMSPAARNRWDTAYSEMVLDFPSKDGTYFDLLGGKRPADAGLRVKSGTTAYDGDPNRLPEPILPGTSPSYVSYAAHLFLYRLDPDGGFSMVDSIPVIPFKPTTP